jgi:hypothetical protein
MKPKKLKGTNAFETILTEIASTFGVDKVIIADDCCYWSDSHTIWIKIVDDEYDKMFMEFVSERFDIDIGSSLLIGLLHEIGHYETLDEMSELVIDMSDKENDRIEKEMKDTEDWNEIRRLEWQYFNLPDEIMATYWAVDFIKNNFQLVNIWNKRLQKAYEAFLRINNIVDED